LPSKKGHFTQQKGAFYFQLTRVPLENDSGYEFS